MVPMYIVVDEHQAGRQADDISRFRAMLLSTYDIALLEETDDTLMVDVPLHAVDAIIEQAQAYRLIASRM